MDGLFVAIDGASEGNPGPAGIGIVLFDHEGNIIETEGRFIGHATNNQAEYQALVFALEKALALKIPNLKVQTDSELLYYQIKGRYHIRSLKLKPLFQQVSRLIKQLPNFELVLVSRDQNKAPDRAAKRAIAEATKKTIKKDQKKT